jgi:hypothetical protein
MSTQKSIEPLTSTQSERSAQLRSQFGSEAIELEVNALYERHLVFDGKFSSDRTIVEYDYQDRLLSVMRFGFGGHVEKAVGK